MGSGAKAPAAGGPFFFLGDFTARPH